MQRNVSVVAMTDFLPYGAAAAAASALGFGFFFVLIDVAADESVPWTIGKDFGAPTCAACHIGAGASWFVKSKLSGLRQVWAVLTDDFSRPIPTPVHDLRPARDTCEQCQRCLSGEIRD